MPRARLDGPESKAAEDVKIRARSITLRIGSTHAVGEETTLNEITSRAARPTHPLLARQAPLKPREEARPGPRVDDRLNPCGGRRRHGWADAAVGCAVRCGNHR